MRRRDFVTLVGSAAVAWPVGARAQPKPPPAIGFLTSLSQRAFSTQSAAFLQGLKEKGFTEGRDFTIEYRFAEGRYDRLAEMADELMRRPLAVLATSGGTLPARAAKAAARNTPIVFGTADDPVAAGLVNSLSRPGGNLTGVSFINGELTAKNLDFIHTLVPSANLIAVLINPTNPSADTQLRDAELAAAAIGVKILPVKASTEQQIEAAFTALVQEHAGALIVETDPQFFRPALFAALSARYSVPAIYFFREYVAAGGLISYGASLSDSYRQIGIYVARILNGEKPADLPIMQPTRFELVINLSATKALGLTVPDKLLVAADELIE
jgi:putative tryptophan/tyrosine transport system substrate-binding protein